MNRNLNRRIHQIAEANGLSPKFHRKLGIISAATRMLDKMNRIVSLVTKDQQKVNDESLRDTLIDIANYAVMTIMEIDKKKERI